VRKTSATVGSAAFFLAAPGMVAGVLPWWLSDGWQGAEPPWPWPVRAGGAALIAGGIARLVHAFARFVTEGRGTPAPVAPTTRLVVGGLYRHVRNPMYVAVLAAIAGQALLLGRPRLLAYGAAVFGAVASFVRWYEEPTLLARYGADYEAYRRGVRAWVPRLRPWDGTGSGFESRTAASEPPGSGTRTDRSPVNPRAR
jgi:protein-S-isoprenylcysteine O-methyltransferase Ste14